MGGAGWPARFMQRPCVDRTSTLLLDQVDDVEGVHPVLNPRSVLSPSPPPPPILTGAAYPTLPCPILFCPVFQMTTGVTSKRLSKTGDIVKGDGVATSTRCVVRCRRRRRRLFRVLAVFFCCYRRSAVALAAAPFVVLNRLENKNAQQNKSPKEYFVPCSDAALRHG